MGGGEVGCYVLFGVWVDEVEGWVDLCVYVVVVGNFDCVLVIGFGDIDDVGIVFDVVVYCLVGVIDDEFVGRNDFFDYGDMICMYIGDWFECEDSIGSGCFVVFIVIGGLVLSGVGIVVNGDVGDCVGIGDVLLVIMCLCGDCCDCVEYVCC